MFRVRCAQNEGGGGGGGGRGYSVVVDLFFVIRGDRAGWRDQTICKTLKV